MVPRQQLFLYIGKLAVAGDRGWRGGMIAACLLIVVVSGVEQKWLASGGFRRNDAERRDLVREGLVLDVEMVSVFLVGERGRVWGLAMHGC